MAAGRHHRRQEDTVDIIENIQGAWIQHGPLNDRIYLMHLGAAEPMGLIMALDRLAVEKGYGKIFAKIPASAWAAFKEAAFRKEAVVPGFFRGGADGLFVAKYFSLERRAAALRHVEALTAVVHQEPSEADGDALQQGGAGPKPMACTPLDAEEMARLYRRVFPSYPFPIQEPAYLRRMMRGSVRCFAVRVEGTIAALAAAEIDAVNRNAEMTDFATLPRFRGHGFAGVLLCHMDEKARALGVKTAYTIARAESRGMNAVFKRGGYRYAGLLKNNSHICGSLQSMAVWYKHL
jgi:putative beta-lysine N-acetyltransferase